MTYPWVKGIGGRPWEIAVGVYPRTVTIKRPVAVTGGPVSYAGAVEANETVLASDVVADVSIQSSGRTTIGGALPDDTSRVTWVVTIAPANMQGLPEILEEDRVYDDLGRRFVVNAAEPTATGLRLDCVRLKS